MDVEVECGPIAAAIAGLAAVTVKTKPILIREANKPEGSILGVFGCLGVAAQVFALLCRRICLGPGGAAAAKIRQIPPSP